MLWPLQARAVPWPQGGGGGCWQHATALWALSLLGAVPHHGGEQPFGELGWELQLMPLGRANALILRLSHCADNGHWHVLGNASNCARYEDHIGLGILLSRPADPERGLELNCFCSFLKSGLVSGFGIMGLVRGLRVGDMVRVALRIRAQLQTGLGLSVDSA